MIKVPSFLGMPKDFRHRKYHRMKIKNESDNISREYYSNIRLMKNINAVKQQRQKYLISD